MTKQALVIEGGGMKAAYANGVLTAFEEAGHQPWDAVIGTSAGGALAAWYSAGQAKWAEDTWPYAADPRILNYARAMTRRGPLLDHEALLDIVYVDEHPLDLDALRGARWPVIVTAANADTGAMVYKDIRTGDAIAWLKATGRLPLGSGDPVTIDGQRYLDGGVIDPVPTRYAVHELGATQVTLITNKPLGPKRGDSRLLVEWTGRKYPAIRDGLRRHEQIKWDSVQFIAHPPAGVTGHLISPSVPTSAHRLTRDVAILRDTIALGHADGVAHLRSLEADASITE